MAVGGLTMDFRILPLDEAAMTQARQRQAQLAKPPGSLGRLEDLSVQLAGITGRIHNKIEKSTCWCLRLTTAWWKKVYPVRLKA